jgi:hypothetical protein
MITGRHSRTEYGGINARWTCTGPNAVAPALAGQFWVDHGTILNVSLRAERRTEMH